ncbi:MAG: PIN domain-containing protein [Burkholderiaceae bacterium]
MRVLLDTNLLIDGRLDHPGHEAFVSSLTYAELENGVVVTCDPQQRFFGTGLPFDDDAAEAYGTIVQLVIAQGRTPRRRIADLMIAAIALANGAGIITRNAGDFAGLERLVRIIPA